MTDSLVVLENVSKSYAYKTGETTALKNVSLAIDKGEFVCIWGASGSGKSTLLNIAGLIDRPDSGKLLINNEDVSTFNETQAADYRNQKMGFIFQNFNLIAVLSALENVMIPLQVRGVNDKVAEDAAKNCLAEVGLEEHIHKRPDQMSGGQRQRVAIARALMGEPELIFADEPTANLDSKTSDSVIALMKSLNEKKGVTFVFSTHDPQVLSFASRIITIKDGLISSLDAKPAINSSGVQLESNSGQPDDQSQSSKQADSQDAVEVNV